MSDDPNCKTCEPMLLDHAYGLLDAAESHAVVAHLAACPACGAEVARMGGLFKRAAVGSFPGVRFDPTQLPKPTVEPKVNRPGRTMQSSWIKWTVAATVLLAVCASTPARRACTSCWLHRWWRTCPRAPR